MASSEGKAPTAAAAATSTPTTITATDLAATTNDHVHVLVDLRFASRDKVTAFLAIMPGHFAECRKEPGLIRMILVQDTKDALHFFIVEEYKSMRDTARTEPRASSLI
jgi:hypothetical protein